MRTHLDKCLFQVIFIVSGQLTVTAWCPLNGCLNGGTCIRWRDFSYCRCTTGYNGGGCELTDENFARGQPTWQSSTYEWEWDEPFNFTSDLAVDGNRDWNLFRHSCTRTDDDGVNPWWAVDLNRTMNVRRVVFYNRQDDYPERANDFIVGLTNVSPADQPPIVGSYDLCGRLVGAAKAVNNVNCSTASPEARYVIIQLNRTGILTICELEVYEQVSTPTSTTSSSTKSPSILSSSTSSSTTTTSASTLSAPNTTTSSVSATSGTDGQHAASKSSNVAGIAIGVTLGILALVAVTVAAILVYRMKSRSTRSSGSLDPYETLAPRVPDHVYEQVQKPPGADSH